ncbi:nitrous oxide reductase family maturation protein NosD [Lentibacillus lipolyticus]|nr:nitrous oxide reductase family maturation protein NosD [Lentibacillus lipolyticus]
MIKRFGIFITILSISVMLFPGNSYAKDLPSIQTLLKQADPGSVIQLQDRVYQGNVVIDKPVTLKGTEGTVIKGTGHRNVITIKHDGTTLKNVTIKNSGSVLDEDNAGIKIYSDNNQVINTTIKDSLHGIYLNENKGNKLIGNKILGNQEWNQSRRGDGIHLFHSSKNLIKDNTIDGSRDGVYFSFSGNNRIKQNHITNTRYGLHYMYSDDNEFYGNAFMDNTGGAAIMYSDRVTLVKNRFYDHHDMQSFGILLQTANDTTIEKNEIHFNQKGIFMDQSNRNFIKGNLITNNQIGLNVWNSSIDNRFTENKILDNNLQYTTNGGEDANDWSVKGTGNAWSDHTAVDLDQDGVSDEPYEYSSAFGSVLADQQLGNLFLYSPALTLYEKWNQLINTEGGIRDPHPIEAGQQSMYEFSSILWILGFVLAAVGLLRIRAKRY